MSLETEFLGVKLNELEKAYEILVNSKNAKTNAEITENYNAMKMKLRKQQLPTEIMLRLHLVFYPRIQLLLLLVQVKVPVLQKNLSFYLPLTLQYLTH